MIDVIRLRELYHILDVVLTALLDCLSKHPNHGLCLGNGGFPACQVRRAQISNDDEQMISGEPKT